MDLGPLVLGRNLYLLDLLEAADDLVRPLLLQDVLHREHVLVLYAVAADLLDDLANSVAAGKGEYLSTFETILSLLCSGYSRAELHFAIQKVAISYAFLISSADITTCFFFLA